MLNEERFSCFGPGHKHTLNQDVSTSNIDLFRQGISQMRLKYLDESKNAMLVISSLYETIIKQNKKVVFFLDYDGTLSPIVDDPDKAFMPDKTRKVIQEIGKLFPTAIVSGREKKKLYNFVQVDGIFYAGSHGMDITGPLGGFLNGLHGGGQFEHVSSLNLNEGINIKFELPQSNFDDIQRTIEYLNDVICSLNDELQEEKKKRVENHSTKNGVSHQKLVWLEDNRFSLSVHYRLDNNAEIERLESEIDRILLTTEEGSRLRKGTGKNVFELKPKLNWNKGSAVQWILEALNLFHDSNVFPIYIGDDMTDEDAFKKITKSQYDDVNISVNTLEKNIIVGVPILVINEPSSKQTNADYYLKDTAEVLQFLETFVNMENERLADKQIL